MTSKRSSTVSPPARAASNAVRFSSPPGYRPAGPHRLHRLLERRLEILFSAESRVDDLAALVENDDVRCRGDVVGARRVALRVEELIAGHPVLLDERLHPVRRLVHRHRDA